MDDVIAWYNRLFEEENPQEESINSKPTVASTTTPEIAKSYAPWKVNLREINSNKTRARAKELGAQIPCDGCKAANVGRKCCQEINSACTVLTIYFEILDPAELKRLGLDPLNPW
ncbi:uncharacterized protein ATNIH1004_005298 [Aspergillus tanneri]|nr:uncharacterized protein ATNIH1004_005298 [Aspergillus tanneri]KAA8649397.1 hypothetical protein ATNIH1004_005298 [Aspergillus tanneri]